MNHTEKVSPAEAASASVLRNGPLAEEANAHGHYTARCYDKDGNLKWEDTIDNIVCTEGKNILLNALYSTYTVVGPYMGLISSTPTCAAADSIGGTHAGWTEVTNYSGTRGTPSWTASTSNSLTTSAATTFSITGTVVVGGLFLVIGSGASSTISNTGGKLWSCGAFTGGNKSCSSGDTIQASYTLTM
jgi:hypothetical protein